MAKKKHKILIVDDERSIRHTLREILEFEDFEVDEAENGMEGLAKAKDGAFDLLIMDIKMPQMDGLQALERLQELQPDLPIIMISGHGTIETAVEAVKKGAFDYISKPPDLNRLLITVRNALDRSSLISETKVLKKKVAGRKSSQMIGQSAPMQQIQQTIERVAPSDTRILILGPNGSGKELVARQIHEKSKRSKNPMIEVNCAAIPSELIESELFGHEKGSFTSAIKQRIGKFEQANGGTLFLDEIGDMSLSAQAKVLRALQESTITRVGGDKEIKVDVRVIAATNKDLRKEIAEGRFREDLYHRLAVIIIPVPSLNERKEDIPLLVKHFMDILPAEMGIPPKEIEEQAIQLLQQVNWTGNIRELRNVVERLMILSGPSITTQDVQTFVLATAAPNEPRLYDIFRQSNTWEEVQSNIKTAWEKWIQSCS